MPFTLSHPAVVLPLGMKKSKYVDFTALVLGSMAPDFEYFIYFRPIRIIGHSLLGQFYFNLPIILILACIFHYIIKEPMITHLPKPFCNQYYYIARDKWKLNSVFRITVFIYSALIGAFSHIIWDGFTHRTGMFVEAFTILQKYVSVFDRSLRLCTLLQYMSTLIGLLLIGLFVIYKGVTSNSVTVKTPPTSKIFYWSGVILINILVLLIKKFLAGNLQIVSFIVTSIDGFIIGLIIMSFLNMGSDKKGKNYRLN